MGAKLLQTGFELGRGGWVGYDLGAVCLMGLGLVVLLVMVGLVVVF